MGVLLNVLKKEGIENSSEFISVEKVATELLTFLNQEEIRKLLAEKNKKGISSKAIEEIILPKAKELGFENEKEGLFADYPSNGLRPDYYKKLGNTKGILMEVERGKTTINNMDMLDIWKCHICKEANYLLLIVPQLINAKKSKKSKKSKKNKKPTTFDNVVKRIQPFFEKENYINIDAVFVFGY
ncbi:MAG: hypothetical protein LBR10_09395 [Prevotellaceae bacterium]|jgi:hypothetical protein|nr:hypothetical protein [Prevotellaceae bacterium]